MQRISIIIIFFSILLAGCRGDEFNTVGPDIDISIPIEVSKVDVSGVIRNESGATISAATIELYRGEEVVLSATSNANGKYILEGIFTIPEEYRIVIHKDFHITNFKSVEFSSEEEETEIDLYLFTEAFTFGESTIDPLDSELIFLSGSFINQSNHSGPLFLLALDEFGNSLNVSGTNEEYDFEFAMHKQTSFELIVIDACGYSLYADFYNGFEESSELFNDEPIYVSSNLVRMTGTVETCDGIPISNEVILVSINEFTVQESMVDEFGNFEIEVYSCEEDPYVIVNILYEDQSSWNNFVVIENNGELIELGEFQLVCDHQGSIELVLDGQDTLFLDEGFALANLESIFIKGGLESCNFQMIVSAFDTGLYEAEWFSVYLNGEELSIDAIGNINVVIDITSFGEENGSLFVATLYGQVKNWNTNEVINITGTISVPIFYC